MSHAMNRRCAIVGAAETDTLGALPGHSRLMLHAEAIRNALRDCGLKMKDIDGVFSAQANPNELTEYLGIVPRVIDGTNVGGCSYMILLRHATAAIAAGHCNVAVVVHGESGKSRVDQQLPISPQSPQGQWESPFGTGSPAVTFALAATRHFAQYGTTRQQMAHVPAATREWARLSPKAIMRDKGSISVEDVLKARMITWPFGLLDCCLVADGGGALIIVGAERARDFPKKPVWIDGTGESSAHRMSMFMRDLTTSDSAKVSGREAFQMAGIGPTDVRHAMLYDAFSITPMFALEDLGFVKPGESGAFISEKRNGPDGKPIYRIGPGGDFPLNTNGGGLSYCHTGKYGMFALLEAVYQLRGEAGARQVKDLQLSLVHGPGRQFAAAGTVILSNR